MTSTSVAIEAEAGVNHGDRIAKIDQPSTYCPFTFTKLSPYMSLPGFFGPFSFLIFILILLVLRLHAVQSHTAAGKGYELEFLQEEEGDDKELTAKES